MGRKTCWLGALAILAAAITPLASQEGRKDERDYFASKTERYKKAVTEIRGLEFRKPVTVGVYSKEELLKFLKEELDREFPREKAERFQRAYAMFGLIPKDMDLYDALMKLLGGSIAGFYHPKTKELRLIRGAEEEDLQSKALKAVGIDMEAITMVHELTHAAQDQNFELCTLPLDDETNDDLILALKSVIEGDASMVGWKYALKGQFEALVGPINAGYKTGQLPGEAGTLPAYLRHSLTFPYGHGADFVLKGIKGSDDGIKSVSRLFKDFPLSSEQILHPAKYYEERDNPTLVTLPGLEKMVGPPWNETVNNVHGEFAVGVILREFRGDNLTAADVRRAQEGWDGDRYVILGDTNGGSMCAWYTTWDSEKDAGEFFKSYAAALARKHRVPGRQPVEDPKAVLETPDGPILLERRGHDVLAIEGASWAFLAKAETVWKCARKTEMTGFERLKRFVCEKDGVKEAFSGACPVCGRELQYKDEKKPTGKPRDRKPAEKKRREY